MAVQSVRILDAAGTYLAAVVDGREWTGIRCHIESGAVVVDGDGQIPDAVKSWIAAGNVPAAFAVEMVVPESVEMWQAKAALLSVDLYDAADAAVAASGNIALQSIWIDGNTVRRDSPAIAAIGQALGLTPEGIDLLFVAAAQMQV